MKVFMSRNVLFHEHVFSYRTSSLIQYKHPTPVNIPSLWSDPHYGLEKTYSTESSSAGEVQGTDQDFASSDVTHDTPIAEQSAQHSSQDGHLTDPATGIVPSVPSRTSLRITRKPE